jgi:hypothetical protein
MDVPKRGSRLGVIFPSPADLVLNACVERIAYKLGIIGENVNGGTDLLARLPKCGLGFTL